ncbi:LOW QUALITY PROTEIN: hypothetical protein HID58_064085 [Brassica napus]|uniref:Uncharacterized protein n=1 Tax=Brassica napus TaxID=3708 RepID=A0ABQ7Z8Y9_BRANA|nr:LOW QUALITY PROTEIN: hypothetical protein HID58_064085 [Brassica napus]
MDKDPQKILPPVLLFHTPRLTLSGSENLASLLLPVCFVFKGNGSRGPMNVPSCGISLLALLPLLVHISCTPVLHCDHFSILTNAITLNMLIRKGIPSKFRSGFLFLILPRKKSIFLESYYSDLSNTVIGRPQATLQIDHRLQCTCPEKAQTTMKSLFNSLLFSDSLKNLRTQLYSAVKVVETQNDYAIKALVNTVDHLGSVTYKVTEFVDEKVDQLEPAMSSLHRTGSRGRSLTRTSTIICQRDWGDSPSNAKEVDEENQPSLVEKDKSCKRLLE